MEQTNGVVIYASKYGTTERYAQAFATLMGLPLCDLKQCQALASEPGIEKVYVFAPIYRRIIMGLPEISHVFDPAKVVKVFVVGMTSPEDHATIHFLQEQMLDYMPNATMQLLGGKIVFDDISMSDKMLLRVMYGFEKRKALADRTPTEQRLVEMFEEGKADMTDMTKIHDAVSLLE